MFVCVSYQASVELLGQFKEFMSKYGKEYDSEEGESTARCVQLEQQLSGPQ